ncbi:MAG: type II toxin-antitoxin system VapC family toxin [Deinococcales bacterium]
MYILDSNTCIYIMNHQPRAVRAKFAAQRLDEIAISSISLFELSYRVRKSQRVEQNLERLEQFTSMIQVLAFDAKAAEKAAFVRHYLRERGETIGDMDTLIAGHALSVDAWLISHNLKEFQRVPDLKLADWLS